VASRVAPVDQAGINGENDGLFGDLVPNG